LTLEWKGAVAAVTGAASGIGRSAALQFAREGADIVVSDVNKEGSAEVVAEIEALGRKAISVPADVSKEQDVLDLVDASIAWQGHCDLFMSNAGIGLGGAPHLIPQEAWDNILAINLHSHIWAVRRILPHMLERGSGHLVHTASSAGTIGFAQLIPYCVTKFGVVGLCESLAGYVADRGIGVSVICPLVVATNIAERSESYNEEDLPPEVEEQVRGFMAQVMASGLSPDRVATDVVDAVNGNHLYVFPHPELKEMIDAKWRDPDKFVRDAAGAWTAQRDALRSLTGSGSAS
jgi:NAD(P)-dependent dehydrogenase (short-subunit alcohol dehydrogenase family)